MDAVTKPKRKSALSAGRAYPDLHEHVRALEKAGLLIRVDRPINKDTEMHPLVRWQFRGGIAEKDRKAFLFTNVIDSKGTQIRHPGAWSAALAANREIYRIGMGCPLEKIDAGWSRAAQQPIPPRVVDNAPCHEIVITGERSTSRAGPRRHPDADLDAGLGHRALHHAVAIHHQGSRDRRAEHGQLPRPGEGARAGSA